MKKGRSVARRQMTIVKPAFFAGLIIVLIAAGAAAYYLTKPASNYKAPAVLAHSPAPSPGTAGNAGDAAKQQNQSQTVATPTPSSAASSSIHIAGFSVSVNAGTAHVSSTISGTSSGTCSLTLKNPKGDTDQTATGQVIWNVQSYLCSFDNAITGISESGTWTANLSVSGNGGASGNATTIFEVQ